MGAIMDLFEYPNTPGYRHRETSKEAAANVSNVSDLHAQIIGVLSQHCFTVYELADFMDMEFRKVQPRCSELAAQGRIIDSGVRRKTPYGRNAICWRLSE